MAESSTGRRVVAAMALFGILAGSGCLTLSPTVTTGASDSAVFEEISATEPWASRSVTTTVRLTPDATTTAGVTRLVVITEGGSSFDSTIVERGQTSVTVYLPTNQNATIVAVNTANGAVVETRPVVTSGNKLF